MVGYRAVIHRQGSLVVGASVTLDIGEGKGELIQPGPVLKSQDVERDNHHGNRQQHPSCRHGIPSGAHQEDARYQIGDEERQGDAHAVTPAKTGDCCHGKNGHGDELCRNQQCLRHGQAFFPVGVQ